MFRIFYKILISNNDHKNFACLFGIYYKMFILNNDYNYPIHGKSISDLCYAINPAKTMCYIHFS